MSFLKLLRTKFKRELEDAEQGLIANLAKVDFATVEEHQLNEYEATLTQLSLQLAKASTVKEKENKDLANAIQRKTQLISDANKLNAKIESDTLSVEAQVKFESHLAAVLDEIETMDVDIAAEKVEADEATAHFNLLKEAVEAAAKKLSTAKKMLGNKKKELDRVVLEETRIKEREDQQKVLMGIKTQSDSLGTVVNAMDNEIIKRKEKIAATQLKMNALNNHMPSNTSTVDSEIAEVLGNSPAPKKSLAERMAALK
jgi:chromosome segregation ATPase